MTILIVGAGPVGLATALRLEHQGIPFRIIDRKEGRESLSKALAIHARTLELLEPLGLADPLIAAGYKMRRVHFLDRGKERVSLDFANLRHRYNFAVLLPQCETEKALEEHLKTPIEWGCEMVELSQDEERVTAQIKTKEGMESAQFDYLIGADGAHSWTRKSLQIPFGGKAYRNDWSFLDARMSWRGRVDEIFLNMLPHGEIHMIFPIRPGLYRIAVTSRDARVGIPEDAELHEIVWESTFRIQCRQVATYQKGRIFLAGDAAHIHSPAGGRGMNLGIEDALTLAEKIAAGKTDEYTKERLPKGRRVIWMTEAIVRLQTVQNPLLRLLRNSLLYPLLRLKTVQRRILSKMAGLK